MLVVHSQKTERIEKFMQTRNFIYRNELDKACFQHDMAYGESKDLTKSTQSDKVLGDKAFKIANDPKYGYQRGLASMFFNKKHFLIKTCFLIKNLVEVVLTLNQIINLQMNFIDKSVINRQYFGY